MSRIRLILASGSPRRKEILETLGLDFTVLVSDADESEKEKDPARLVELLARKKALAVKYRMMAEGTWGKDVRILAADTVVAVDREILGKPRNDADAARMLSLLSGRAHEVVSGICVLGEDTVAVSHESTKVWFDPLSPTDILSYLKREKTSDKAGAYAIQGKASAFIPRIEGDYFNVVGLPVHLFFRLMKEEFGEQPPIR